MSSEFINKAYPYAALFIHSCGMMVTREKMQALFSTLGLEFQPKIADLFAKSDEEFKSLISIVSTSGVAASPSAAVVEETKVEEKKKEEVKDDGEGDIDFDDFF